MRLIGICERKLLKTRDPLPCIFPSWVRLPQILLERESLLNDASGLMLFRFAIAAGVTGGAVVGVAVGTAWVALARRLGDE
jgi:hypothetical protein